MRFLYFLILLLVVPTAASAQAAEPPGYMRWVGDIAFDPRTDDPNIALCWGDNWVLQYFNLSEGLRYNGEKPAIDAFFKANYQPVELNQSGYLRIRFVVNCQGQTNRFRLLEADEHYNARPFDPAISQQLLQLCKQLEGWEVIEQDGRPIDYYQYLLFKIKQGQIERILP